MQLDALSNYHYAPPVLNPRLRLQVNERAAKKREVAATLHDVADADATTTLAPEQIAVCG